MSKPAVSGISDQTLSRLPYYLRIIDEAKQAGKEYISAPAIAAELKLHEIQVRKDLAAVFSENGIPKKGFSVNKLLADIKDVMGTDKIKKAVLVGAGSLGSALLSYEGFSEYGMQIVAGFDRSKKKIGKTIGGKPISSIEFLSEFCRQHQIKIGIITVPADSAQEICDLLVSAGVLGILNFAPLRLTAPEQISIQNVNMAASLLMLSQHLRQQLEAQELETEKKL